MRCYVAPSAASAEICKNITLQGWKVKETEASADVVSDQIPILRATGPIIKYFSALDGNEKKSLLF